MHSPNFKISCPTVLTFVLTGQPSRQPSGKPTLHYWNDDSHPRPTKKPTYRPTTH